MDNNIVFQDIGNARANFEASFAKAELGGILKEIVIRSTPKSDIYKDANINRILGSAMNEVAGSAFTNLEANRATFVGSIKETINEFASMEADYRQQKVLARVAEGQLDWSKEKDRVLAQEYMESSGFKSPVLQKDYREKMQFIFSLEAKDIVLEIGKEVGTAIAEAENKNAVIATAINVITEEKEKIKEDLKDAIKDDEDEEDEDDAADNSPGLAEDMGEDEEDIDADENETGEEDDEDEGEEDLDDDEAGEESSDDKFVVFEENQETPEVGLDQQLDEGAAKTLNEEIKVVVSDEEVEEYDDIDSETVLDEKLNEESDNVEGSVESWMDLPKPVRVQYAKIISQSVENYEYGLENIFKQTKVNREQIKKALPEIDKFKDIIIKDAIEIRRKLKTQLELKKYSIRDPLVYRNFKTDKAYIESEWKDLIESLKTTKSSIGRKRLRIPLIDIIGNKDGVYITKYILTAVPYIVSAIIGSLGGMLGGVGIMIGNMLLDKGVRQSNKAKSITRRAIKSADLEYKVILNSSSGVGQEKRMYFTVILECKINFNPLQKKYRASSEAFVNRFRELKYSNKNIGYTLYPVSPNRFDNLKIPPTNELSNIFVKGEEDIRDFVTARLGALKEFVDREQDEALTSKYNLYHKISMEALDIAELKKDKMWKVGLTPKGIVDKEDPFNIKIGLNMAKLMTRGFESFEDSLNDDTEPSSIDVEKVSDYDDVDNENAVREKLEENGEEGAVEEAEADKEDQATESFNRLIDQTFYLAGLRNEYKKYVSPQVKERIQSIEGELYEQIAWLPEEKKDQIINVMEFTTTAIDPKALMKDAFLEDIKLTVENTTVRTELATNTEEEIFAKVKERVGFILNRELDADEISLIKAISSNQDSVDTIPSIFEKLVVKLGKEEMKDKSAELGEENLEFIRNKATALLTLHTAVNKLDILDNKSLENFNEYVLGGYLV